MNYKYIYGPVASRRLGKSLGIAPITNNLCNFGCVYCQLGQTHYIPNEQIEHFKTDEIIAEIEAVLKNPPAFDMISIVGDGEPILHSGLKDIIARIKSLTNKPLALITNGSLLYRDDVIDAIQEVDILLPSLDAYNDSTFKRINRPFGGLAFNKIVQGLEKASRHFKGKIWLEIMFLKGYNDDEVAIANFKNILQNIRYERLYLNTPVRPTREKNMLKIDAKKMDYIQKELGGIPIDFLSKEVYMGVGDNIMESLIALIKRHPLHYHEIVGFLKDKSIDNYKTVIEELDAHEDIVTAQYHGFTMYQYKKR